MAIVRGLVTATVGAGMFIGGFSATGERLGDAAVQYGTPEPNVDTGARVGAFLKGNWNYAVGAANDVCDNVPLLTPCDRKKNSANVNDSVIIADGLIFFSWLGGIALGGGLWLAAGGTLGKTRDTYNKGSGTIGASTI